MNESDLIAELHEKGAAKWGGDWMEANTWACQILMGRGMRPVEHKELGTWIAWRMCQWGDMIAERERQATEDRRV